jgi:hypothetical protein
MRLEFIWIKIKDKLIHIYLDKDKNPFTLMKKKRYNIFLNLFKQVQTQLILEFFFYYYNYLICFFLAPL